MTSITFANPVAAGFIPDTAGGTAAPAGVNPGAAPVVNPGKNNQDSVELSSRQFELQTEFRVDPETHKMTATTVDAKTNREIKQMTSANNAARLSRNIAEYERKAFKQALIV